MGTITEYPGFKDIVKRCVTVDGQAHTVYMGTCTDKGLEGEPGVFKINDRAIWRTPEPLRSRIIDTALHS